MKKNICIVTGSRAEWGHLKLLAQELQNCYNINPQLLVTGSHLFRNAGYTVNEILGEGFSIDSMVQLGKEGIYEPDMFEQLSQGFRLIPEEIKKLAPDLIIVLGDRYEIFMVASIARLMQIPLCHISGGELTSGALDDCLRHSITKLADIHFVATEEYRQRVIQLGEQSEAVFNVGDLGLADLEDFEFLGPDELFEVTGFKPGEKNVVVTLHPETCSPGKVYSYLLKLVGVLQTELPDFQIFFTGANSDPGGPKINQKLKIICEENPERFHFIQSCGRRAYLSLCKLSKIVIGNSSSGVVEIPSLRVPVINIGRRQAGRLKAQSVIDIGYLGENLRQGINYVFSEEYQNVLKVCKNPYFAGNTAKKIANIISKMDFSSISKEKEFNDLKTLSIGLKTFKY